MSEPQISVPLDEWTEALITRTIQKHMLTCPMRPRVERLEVRLASLIAFMAGSGLLGGVSGAFVAKVIGL